MSLQLQVIVSALALMLIVGLQFIQVVLMVKSKRQYVPLNVLSFTLLLLFALWYLFKFFVAAMA